MTPPSAVNLPMEQLAELCSDLEACADEVRVIVRDGARGNARASSLARVADEIRAGRGVQLRYVYEGERWIDTLRPEEAGVRLIRMREPA